MKYLALGIRRVCVKYTSLSQMTLVLREGVIEYTPYIVGSQPKV